MGNTIRFSGLSSGLDTASIVNAIMTPHQTKINTIKQNTTLAEWRKEAYKEMSLKIKNFRDNAVSKLKYASTLNQAKATLSQEGAITVNTNKYVEDGTHKIEVTQVAEQASVKTGIIKDQNGNKLTSESKVSEMAGMKGMTFPCEIKMKINGDPKEETITINDDTTISDLVKEFNSKGLKAKFDEGVGAFFISSKETGANQTIDFDGTDSKILAAMGMKADATTNKYSYSGKEAKVTYNGDLTITSESNDIEINGLSFTVQAETTTPITVVVRKDIDAMVNTVKDFVTEYNNLLEEINTKLNADSASSYKPLTDEEKEAMTEKEIELWESKIKGSLFRRDSTLTNINNMLKNIMLTDYNKEPPKKTVNGKDVNEYEKIADKSCSMLAQIGISSSSWSDKGKLTVNEEKLREALSNNGDGVVNLLTTVANRIDNALIEASKSTDSRSYGQYFNDKIQTNNIAIYKQNLITAQARYDKLENMYYKKFTAMETAMNKLNSQSSLFASF